MAQSRDPVTGRFVSAGGGASSGGGGFNLGNAYGAVIIDVSGVGSAMQQAQNSIRTGLSGISSAISGIGDRISSIGDTFSRLGGAISVFSAPLAIAGGVGLKTAADFDDLMKQIELFGNVAPEQLDTVRKFALKMGADTKFSSADAASALLELLKSGQSLEEAMTSLPRVLELATVGNLGLANASGVVTSALAIFGLNAQDAARVSDVLARAAGASRADVNTLGQALVNVGPGVRDFKLSIEDTAAILAIFSQNGIEGSEAGNQLRSMLTNLSRPTDDVQEAFDRLGVSLFDSNGQSRDFNTIIKEMNDALSDLSDRDRIQITQTLAGSFGVVGLKALVAAGSLEEMKASMNGQKSAAEIAAAMMETFKGKVESLMGSIDTFMNVSMTPFMNDIGGPLVDRITEVVNRLTAWAEANPELTKQIVSVLSVVAALGPTLLVVGRIMGAIGPLVGALGSVIGALASPIGLVVAAVGALVWAFQNNFLGIRDLLQPILDQVIGGLETLFGVIGNFGNIVERSGIGTAIAAVINAFMQMLGLVGAEDMHDAAQGIGEGIVGAFITVVQYIEKNVLPVLQMLADWFLNDALPAVIGFIQNVVIPAFQSWFNFVGQLWAIVGPHLERLANWFLTEALPAVLNFVTGTVIPAISTLIQWLVGIWNTVSPYLLQFADWFLNTALPAVINFITTEVIPRVQEFTNTVLGIWTTVQPELEKLWTWFTVDALPAIRDFIVNEVIPRIEDFVNVIEGIWAIVEPALSDLHDWFVTSALPAISGAIQDVMDNFITPLQNLLSGLWDAVKPHLESVYNWFRDSFAWIGTNFIKPVVDFIQSIITKAGEAIDLLRRLGGGEERPATSEMIARGMPANMQSSVRFPQRDVGGMGRAGQAYQIGSGQLQNEIYIPGADGQFVAGFVDLMKRVAAGVSGNGGNTFNIMLPEAALANPAAADAIGRDFARGFSEELGARGVKGLVN